MPNLTSLGEAASVDELYVKLIAPLLPETQTNVQAPVNFKSLSGLTITELDSSGNIDTLGKLSLHSGTNLNSVYSNVNRYSIELDSNFDFVIYDNINDQPRITIDATTGQTTFNPPITGTSLSKVNVDLDVNSFYPLFAATSTSGTISTVDVASNISYTPTTTTLSLGNLASDTITDSSGSFGTSGQVLSSTGSGLLWSTAPTINDGTLSINTGSHLSGSGTFTANQSGNTNISITTDATNLNTVSTIVSRDISGNFSCNNMTGNITGISTSANTIYVLQNNTNTDFQVPVLAATHTANGYYNLKVDPSTSIFTYNTSTHTLKPININISGTLADSSGSVGSSTNLLSSTATGTSWVSAPVVNNGTLTISNGTHITGSGTFTANQAGNTSFTIATDATSLNTVSTIVARDSSGGFNAGTITANLTGTASTAQTVNVVNGASAGNYDILITNTSGVTSNQIAYNSGIYYTPSSGTLHSSIFAGSLTGSATLIDTTLQTTGVQYLTFVPLSATTSAGQVLGTDSALSYDVQFSILTASSFAGNLTGTATNANNTQTYLTSTNFSYNIPFMLYDTATTQATYLDTGGNITYNPSTQTLNANYITSRQLPILWNNDFLIAGYTPTYPSNATLNTYYLLSQLPATGDSGNGITQLFSGVIGGWGGDANCQITFKSRGGMVASGTIISDIITTSALIGFVDLVVYTNGGLFQVYLVVKPNVYYTFNFTMTGLNRDVNSILYQPSIGTTTTPTGTISIASVITAITFTNTGGALTATSLTTTSSITAGTSFSGPGTGLTGTASSLTAGSSNAVLVAASATNTNFPVIFGSAATAATLLNDTDLNYNPSTNILTAGTYSGAGTSLTGTASSLTSGKVSIANDTTTTSMPLLLSNNTSTGTVNYNNSAGLFNASSLVTTIPYLNNSNLPLSNGFGPATSVTISNCFNGIYNFYDITFMVISATAGNILKFNVGPTASSLWNNTYSYSYNTTTPVIVNVNNTSQASVELGSMINGYCMFKLTYISMGYGTIHPMVMWDGFIQNSGGNGWSKGQASYQATSVSFTNAIFTTTSNMNGYYSVRGYN